MRRLQLVVLVVAILVAVTACRDTAPPAAGTWTGTIDTLPSGHLVIRNPDVPLWRPDEAWILRESFRLGSPDGDRPDVFGDIRAIQLGPNDDLYILDAQAAEIRVFKRDGTHARTFGRSGQGPGELNRPAGMALDSAGTLWVLNLRNARFSGFDPNSGHIMSEVRRLSSFAIIPWRGQFDHANRLIDTGLGSDGQPVLLGLDTAFVPRDTLALPQADDRHRIYFRRANLLVMSALDPFAPGPVWVPDPAGGIVIGEGGTYRFHRINFRGDTTATIEVLRAPAPVTQAERDSALAAFQQLADDLGGPGATPDRSPRVPPNKPAHGAVFVDDHNYLWVRHGSGTEWDVIANDGRLLGQVTIPLLADDVMPTVRGNRLAIATEVHGVPVVVVYDLHRAGR